MTIATDLGFKIGELYRVINDENSSYIKNGMIVEFSEDDGGVYPWFKHISGPRGVSCSEGSTISIALKRLVPAEQPRLSSNKPLLLLYIQQQYPDDKVLKALVESL